MNKGDVAVNTCALQSGRDNFHTILLIEASYLPTLVEECWHLREPYYCDDLFKVPVPPTHNGKSSFLTSIVKFVDGFSITTNPVPSPFSTTDTVVEVSAWAGMYRHDLPKAKFAEIIVAARSWLLREGKPATDKPYEIVKFHGLNVKDVPPFPVDMAKNLHGPHANHYKYTLKDMSAAVAFWSQHCCLICR